MRAEPRSRALFAFVAKRGHRMKVLNWDGAGTIVTHKKLRRGAILSCRARWPPRAACSGERCDLRSEPQGRSFQPAAGPATNSLMSAEYSCNRRSPQNIYVKSASRLSADEKLSVEDATQLVATLQSELVGVRPR